MTSFDVCQHLNCSFLLIVLRQSQGHQLFHCAWWWHGCERVSSCVAPPPAVFYPSFSQQLLSADITEAVAVEASAPQDVGSLLTLDGQVVDIPISRVVEEIEDVI